MARTRTNWLDSETNLPIIAEKVQNLESFTDAMADGVIESKELKAQEDRLIAAMKAAEADLSDAQHEKVTRVLVELCAYDIMRLLHELQAGKLRRHFA